MHFIVDRMKGLKSPELETMVTTGTTLTWIPPTIDEEIMIDGDLVKVYSDDAIGIEECNLDRADLRKRKVFFATILPKAVSMTYSTIGSEIMDKMRIDIEYEEAYNKNDIIKLLEMARFASMGEGSSTIYQNMAMLMALKIKDSNFFEYVKKI